MAARHRLEAHLAIADEMQRRFINREDSYVGLSSLFLQPNAVDLAWLWIRDWRSNISGVTRAWSENDRPYRVHRFLLIRDPLSIGNIFYRQMFQVAVRTFCHLQLRDGAVLYVVFISSSDPNLDQLRRGFNASYFLSGRLYPLTDFWSDEYEYRGYKEAQEAREKFREMFSILPKELVLLSLRLWYDKSSFEHRRCVRSARTRCLREFIFRLYGGFCQAPQGNEKCAGVTDIVSGEVDHLVPLAHGTNVLLNLTWLCGSCNKQKGAMRTLAAPLGEALCVIPDEWLTGDIREDITMAAPSWVQYVRSPPLDLRRKIAALKL